MISDGREFHSLTTLTKKDDWKETVLAKGTVSSWS